jgi:hypothetical protein
MTRVRQLIIINGGGQAYLFSSTRRDVDSFAGIHNCELP